ncbi:MAG: energy coupling factor transporter S component ThiW [Candidatus Lokiarchaeota archaeon]|nr:energy coupling factor transporter S component ThiW [Candidatus Lokiarchaeota archaeon]
MEEEEKHPKEEVSASKTDQKTLLTKRVATAAIFMAIGLVLSYLNPFAYFTILGTKINPFAHFINAITGVLIGLTFSSITALGIAILRFALGIGTIHAFHGGISGALVVGFFAYLLRKRAPDKIEFAALTEPIGTIFIGGTIAYIIAPIGSIFEGLLFYWGLFALSCIPGCILGFVMLKILRKAGITWQDYF